MKRVVAAGLLGLAVGAWRGAAAAVVPPPLAGAGSCSPRATLWRRPTPSTRPFATRPPAASPCAWASTATSPTSSARSGPPATRAELFVLRRSVEGRPCLALFWGLFPSRAAARAALPSMPATLRAPGQSPVARLRDPASAAAPPPLHVAAAPSPATLAEPGAVGRRPPPRPCRRRRASSRAPVAGVVSPPPARRSRGGAAPPDAGRAGDAVHVPALEVTAAYSALWDDAFSAGRRRRLPRARLVLSRSART